MPRMRLLPSLVAAATAALVLAVPAAAAPLAGGAFELCRDTPPGVTCRPGDGRRTVGGGEKVSHKGWPAIDGVFWQVTDDAGRRKRGGPDNDELLGHHGSDRLDGGAGHDVLWGDWDPRNNPTRQRDVLIGGAGNDYIYPSHGTTTVKAGPGKDYIWAFYGKGVIDCGPGYDTVRVRLNGAFRLRNCERVGHFCQYGSDGHGGCRKPGEVATRRRDAAAALA
jgi:RTX calcium-binding nonapeptide repeat (4 copies)